MIYDGGFSISENFDGHYTLIYLENGFGYDFQSNISYQIDQLQVKSELIKERVGFALETWSGPHEDENKACIGESEEPLRGWIKRCFGNIRIRQLTDEERAELQRFKEEYNSKFTVSSFSCRIMSHDQHFG